MIISVVLTIGFILCLRGHFGRFWRRYCWNLLIAVDQLANAVLAGDPDETISSRAAKRLHKTRWKILAQILEALDRGHMARAIEEDEGGNAAYARGGEK